MGKTQSCQGRYSLGDVCGKCWKCAEEREPLIPPPAKGGYISPDDARFLREMNRPIGPGACFNEVEAERKRQKAHGVVLSKEDAERIRKELGLSEPPAKAENADASRCIHGAYSADHCYSCEKAEPMSLDHPCRQTCSGWQQGFDRGAASSEYLRKDNADLRDAFSSLHKQAQTAEKQIDAQAQEIERLKTCSRGPKACDGIIEELEQRCESSRKEKITLTARAEAAEKNVNALATQVEALTKENLELSTDLPTRAALKRERDEFERKGIGLCKQNGALLIDIHDWKREAEALAEALKPREWCTMCRDYRPTTRERLARYHQFKGEK